MSDQSSVGPDDAPTFPSWVRAIAVDFDGTLAEGGAPVGETLDALRAARAAGIRIVLVTGRILDELRVVFPDVEREVDAIVAENGAVLARDGVVRRLADAVPDELASALAAREIPARRGLVLLACQGADDHGVLEEVTRLGLEYQLIRNRSELMVLPSGITKGTGLIAALGELRLSAHNTIAVGDAENDHSLLETAEIAIAVANAIPSLKHHADLVLDDPDGRGTAKLLRGDVPTLSRLQSSRWKIQIGLDPAGAAVEVPATGVNLLVAGGSGDGKSYTAGMIAEQLIALRYSVVVIDPEGDHLGLGSLRGVLVVGGERHLPPPAAVIGLVRHRRASVVVDLSHLAAEVQARYLTGLVAEVEAARRDVALPHWVLIDEAHLAVGGRGLGVSVLDPAAKGHCLVTYHPDELSADALTGIDVVVALTNPSPHPGVVGIAAAIADVPRTRAAAALAGAPGHMVVASRAQPRELVSVSPSPRATRHFRHEHKYAAAGIDEARRFHFRTSVSSSTGTTAGNLIELEAELARCERAVLRHHCPRRDLSRWIADVFHDSVLADAVAAVESGVHEDSLAAAVEEARLDLLAALQARAPH